jgi:hypothetical protein
MAGSMPRFLVRGGTKTEPPPLARKAHPGRRARAHHRRATASRRCPPSRPPPRDRTQACSLEVVERIRRARATGRSYAAIAADPERRSNPDPARRPPVGAVDGARCSRRLEFAARRRHPLSVRAEVSAGRPSGRLCCRLPALLRGRRIRPGVRREGVGRPAVAGLPGVPLLLEVDRLGVRVRLRSGIGAARSGSRSRRSRAR